MALTFGETIGALMTLAAMAAVAYLATTGGNEQAQGALISVVAGGVGYFLRGRTQLPHP